MAQFEYGLDKTGRDWHISALSHSQRREPFTCPDCGTPLILSWKNDRKERHFRHSADVPCQGETEIHLRLKYAFEAAFRQAVESSCPFSVEVEQKRVCSHGCCQGRSEWVHYDLRRFDAVTVERRFNHQGKAFIPDCMLTDSRGQEPPLFFEVCVTSKVSDLKVAAGLPILEMLVRKKDHLSADREAQCLEAIQKGFLPSDLVQWHNFELPAVPGATCQNELARLREIHQQRLQALSLAPTLRQPYTHREEYPKTFQSSRSVPDDIYRALVNDLAKLREAGRNLVFLTYFDFNQAFVCRDMDTRLWIVLHDHRDYGPFPNHGAAFDYCKKIKPFKQAAAPHAYFTEEEDVPCDSEEEDAPWWVE